jgi:hypothetical protein
VLEINAVTMIFVEWTVTTDLDLTGEGVLFGGVTSVMKINGVSVWFVNNLVKNQKGYRHTKYLNSLYDYA